MSLPQSIIVDDTSSAIEYSGPWTAVTNSGAYDDSLHLTTIVGATNTLSYIGSPTVTIFGAVESCDSHRGPPTYEITMDGVTGSTMTVPCNSQFQNRLTVTAQGEGPLGVNARHVLTITNLGGAQNLPLMLDYIQYVSYAGESSSSVVQVTPSSARAESPTAASTVASSNTLTSSAHSGSSTSPSLLYSSQVGSSLSTGFPKTLAASTVIQLTTISGVATSIAVVTTPTTIVGSNFSNPSFTGDVSKNSSHPIGPIVGGIIGAVLVTLLLVWLYSRRRRISIYTLTRSKRSPESVTPFNLAPNSSPEEAGSSANRHSNSRIHQFAFIPWLSASGSAQSEQSPEDSTLLYDEKRTSEPLSQAWTSSPPVLESTSESEAQQSFHRHPPSSIAPSHATVPTYVRNPTISRVHYRSGVSAFSISDVPPSYDSVRNADSALLVPPLDH